MPGDQIWQNLYVSQCWGNNSERSVPKPDAPSTLAIICRQDQVRGLTLIGGFSSRDSSRVDGPGMHVSPTSNTSPSCPWGALAGFRGTLNSTSKSSFSVYILVLEFQFKIEWGGKTERNPRGQPPGRWLSNPGDGLGSDSSICLREAEQPWGSLFTLYLHHGFLICEMKIIKSAS